MALSWRADSSGVASRFRGSPPHAGCLTKLRGTLQRGTLEKGISGFHFPPPISHIHILLQNFQMLNRIGAFSGTLPEVTGAPVIRLTVDHNSFTDWLCAN
jgi:hypothetical protein